MAVFGWLSVILSLVVLIAVSVIRDGEGRGTYPYRRYALLPLCVLALGFLFITTAVVPRGNVGVSLLFNAVTGDYREQGLQFKSPLVKLHIMNVRTQIYQADATAASDDLQDVATTIALNYHLSPSGAPAVYRELGDDYINIIAAPAIQETVKQITARFKAEDLIHQRDTVKAQITEALSARLQERGIVTEAVSITNFTFSQVFTAAIEAKVAAQQAVLEAQNKLERIKVEAQQREAQAVGEANALIKEAEGKAKSITIVTAAQVKANNEIAASLSAEVLQYIFYDRLGQDIRVIVIPQGSQFVLPNMSEE